MERLPDLLAAKRELMTELPMCRHCQHDGLTNACWLEERIVNLPSSVLAGWLGQE